MRSFTPFWTPSAVLLSLLVIGCTNDGGSVAGGAGGSAGIGGTAGNGGMGGGVGGVGGAPRACVNPRDCDDGEACTQQVCSQRLCENPPLPDDTVCVSGTGLSACVDGVCQPIWPSCEEPGAEDGDLCEPDPTPNPPRLGRCSAAACEVGPCQVGLDCWSGESCSVGVCNGSDGSCTQEEAPDGSVCVPPIGGVCSGGECMLGTGGGGGSGGLGGQGGVGGNGGNGASGG